MSSQVLKRPLDQQCSPEVKRFRPDTIIDPLANSRPEIVAAVEQLREKYGIHEGIIIAILETCHYSLPDTQREIEKFCQCVTTANEPASSNESRKRPLPECHDVFAQGANQRHPMESIAEACVIAVQGAVDANQAKQRMCIALDRLHDSFRESETRKCEKLQHANKVLFRAYNTLIEKNQALKRKAHEEQISAVEEIQLVNRRLAQENQVLQWRVSHLNQPERHHGPWLR
eukprot:GEMP01011043.1.p1 GENE.GEMP01011043.1~~GEMP01011043.1.p1  ORF type:complete len:230 (+),score=10.95 GEMP01011043.1:162-851(+)